MLSSRGIKTVVFLIVGLSVVLVAYFIFMGIKHSQEGKINLFVLPNDAKVTIDGRVINDRSVYVKPGSHIVEASKTGFKTDRRMIDIAKKEELNLYLIPNPESQEAINWLLQNPDLQRLREEYAAQNVGQTQAKLQQKYPILAVLPIVTPYYRIDYGLSKKQPADPESLALYVTSANEDNKELALKRIREEGFNPDNYELIFKKP